MRLKEEAQVEKQKQQKYEEQLGEAQQEKLKYMELEK